MRIAMYYNNQDIRVVDIPTPTIGPGELLVKVVASGICGTDIMEWYRMPKGPRVLGHEIAGEIVASQSKKYKVGQRVFVSHHVPCNTCKYCRADNHTACDMLHKGNYEPGGFSEFIRIPTENVKEGTYVLPKTVTYEEGTMVEPLACALRGQRVINVRPQQTVLILGSGVSGLLHIQLAKRHGAEVIATDVHEYKLAKAKEFGADHVIHADQALEVKADRIIICTGALAAVAHAFNCIDKKGQILFFAIPQHNVEIPIVDFWRNEITITSSYGAAPVDLVEALDLIKQGEIHVKKMITHVLPLAEIQKGFSIAVRAEESLKVIIKPHEAV